MNDGLLLLLGLLFLLHRSSPGRLRTGGHAVRLKPGVKVRGVRPEILLAIEILAGVFERHPGWGVFELTSVLDGVHMPGSLHYEGLAVDVRIDDPGHLAGLKTTHVPAVDLPVLVSEARAELGDEYDVVLEKDHLHVEFDPKGGGVDG